MALAEALFEFDSTLLTVAVGAATIGAVSGGLGTFAYLRRQGLVGDIVSHSSLLGIVGAFLASYWITGTGSKSLAVLVPGAILAGVGALLLSRAIQARTTIKEDTSLGVMLAIFFGSGLFLLRWVQRASPAIPGHTGLEDYIFGMAAAMTHSDLVMIGILGAISALVLALLWKEFQVFTFDPDYAQSLGLRTGMIDTALLTLLVLGIVIGIQSVGVVLMISLLVTPASAARQWTKRLGAMVGLSAAFGGVSGLLGALLSASSLRLPTGPVVVLVATVIFLVSLLFAPRRGVIARARTRRVAALSAREELELS
ncbi:MAG: metal ABC transporter permease [Planctomycetota bacterium]